MTDEHIQELARLVQESSELVDESRAARNRTAEGDLAGAPDSVDSTVVVAPPANPMAVARQFVTERHTQGADNLLRSHRGDFYAWSGCCWPEAEDRRVRTDLYEWLEDAYFERESRGKVELVPWQPTRHKIANVIDAVQAVTHLDASVSAPAWLDGHTEPADRIVAVANGLLDLRTRALLPHTPAFYSPHALSFPFDPAAPAPRRWHSFLRELWGDDHESIATLGEVMGYVLSGETNLQKIFGLVGPKRSGKGTIGRVLTGLFGVHNTAAPTLSSLTSNFGLSPLIAKPLAVISDARLSNRADSLIAVERLLSISGEDTLTVDRKYKDPWTGRLPTRFMILTNELPRFADASGALASRFVLLILRESFYEREDPQLTDTLLTEASGIFNWALEGLDRLLDRGYFHQPRSAVEALRHLEDLSSPIGAFVRDSCILGPAYQVDKDVLYAAWKVWCEEEGRSRPGTKAVFVRDLRAAVPGVTPVKPREGDRRRRVLQGLNLVGPFGHDPAHANPAVDFLEHDGNEPRTIPDQTLEEPLPGPRSTAVKTAQPSGGPGWSGQKPTVSPTPRETRPIAEETSDRALEDGPTIEKSPDHPGPADADDPRSRDPGFLDSEVPW